MTISGAYGRDYKSKKAILEDLAAGKDFIVRSIDGPIGTYCNIEDLRNEGIAEVMVRYKMDRSVAVIKLKDVK